MEAGASTAYTYAVEEASVAASRAMLVAVHPWDIEGARRAGLRTQRINRGGRDLPRPLRSPRRGSRLPP